MSEGIFTFLPEVEQDGSRFAPFFRWRFEDQMGKGDPVEKLLLEASQKAAQDSVRPGFTGEYVTKDMMIERVGRYVGGEGDKKDEDKKEGYLVFLCEPREGRPLACVYAINGSILFSHPYFVEQRDRKSVV